MPKSKQKSTAVVKAAQHVANSHCRPTLKTEVRSSLWHTLHAPITKDNLPPDDVILSDADAVAVMLVAADGHLAQRALQLRWPDVFDQDGSISMSRSSIGMPATTYYSGDEHTPPGYYYVTCNHTYTFCGREYASTHLSRVPMASGVSNIWLHLVHIDDCIRTVPRLDIFHGVFLTINRRCEVNWDCILLPHRVAWTHMTTEMLEFIASNTMKLYPQYMVDMWKEDAASTKLGAVTDVGSGRKQCLLLTALQHPGVVGIALKSSQDRDAVLKMLKEPAMKKYSPWRAPPFDEMASGTTQAREKYNHIEDAAGGRSKSYAAQMMCLDKGAAELPKQSDDMAGVDAAQIKSHISAVMASLFEVSFRLSTLSSHSIVRLQGLTESVRSLTDEMLLAMASQGKKIDDVRD